MKSINYAVLILTLLISTLSSAQDYQWASQFGASGNSVTSTDMFLDVFGNVYTTGYFTGTVDFNPTTRTSSLVSAGGNDIFITKLDANGNFIWAKNFGSTGSDQGYSIATDEFGDVYVTGNFTGTVDFNLSSTIVNSLTAVGNTDIFVLKLTSSGNYSFVKQFGGTGVENACAISVDASGNLYSAGYFSGSVDFDPGANVVNLVSSGLNDMYVSKLDASGNYLWTKQFGSTNEDLVRALVTDATGAVYFTGSYRGTVDFDPGSGTANLISASSTSDIFVCKIDASGSYIWAKGFGSTVTTNPSTYDTSLPIATERGCGIALDAAGNVYTTGYFQGAVDFDPGAGTYNLISSGNSDAFYSKLTPEGAFSWATRIGGTDADAGYAITLDGYDNLFTVGFFSGTADLEPETGILSVSTAGGNDLFVSQITTDGTLVWAKQVGGTGNDICNKAIAKNNGNLYFTGTFSSTVDFNPTTTSTTLTGLGTQNAFISKWYYTPCLTNNCLAPIITSFAPNLGPIGTTVTITGSNFNTIAANNQVFFGSAKATVTSATASSLTVTVPIGTNYEPITVTNVSNGRSGQSKLSFNVTFSPNKGSVVSSNDFNSQVSISFSTISQSPFLYTADFDGDGKTDIAQAGGNWFSLNIINSSSTVPSSGRTINILRNVSTSGSITSGSFSGVSNIIASATLAIDQLVLGDVDGDGKTDIVALLSTTKGRGDGAITIFRNTSVPGTISFEQCSNVSIPYLSCSFAKMADLNNDGKMELIEVLGDIDGESTGDLIVYENISKLGACNFSNPFIINNISSTNSECEIAQLETGDIDGDGYIDIAYSYSRSGIKIFKNNYQSGILNSSSFSLTNISNSNLNSEFGILLSDLDVDGKLELILASNSPKIFRNTSIPGTISFANPISISLCCGGFNGLAKNALHAGDLNGDGKIDLIIGSIIFTNKLIPGQTLSNSSFQNYVLSSGMYNYPRFVDIDGDGKLDIIWRNCYSTTSTSTSSNLFLRRYDPKGDILIGTVPTQLCPGAKLDVPFTLNFPSNTGNIYTVQLSNATGSFTTPTNIGSINSTELSGTISCLIPSNITEGVGYRIRIVGSTPVNTGNSNGTNITISTTVLPLVSITSSQTSVCKNATISYSSSNSNGGSNPSFQWFKNGISVGSNSISYIDNNALANDKVYCVMTSKATCASTAATSNEIILGATEILTPTILIESNQVPFCDGSTDVLYTGISTNSGPQPIYQWKKNGVIVGNNALSFEDVNPQNGDSIELQLISNASCLSMNTVIANFKLSNRVTWTGTIDSDWHKPCNWSPQVVPSQCNSVVIPLTTNQPVVSGVAACREISIYSSNGANLKVNEGANLQIETCPLTPTLNNCP